MEINLIGADPEFFCKDKSKNKYISMIPYIKGTKKTPEPIPVGNCFRLRDNVSVEINIDPVQNWYQAYTLIQQCIDYNNEYLKKINPNFELDIVSSARYDKGQLRHKEAREYGCEPAYCAYTQGEVYRPDPAQYGGLRSCSYHIHYSFKQEHTKEELCNFIILNDIFLGVPALLLDPTDRDRKLLYGQLGEHRIKLEKDQFYIDTKTSDRVEYRTLGAYMHNYYGFVNNGIELVRNNIQNINTFVELYRDDLLELKKDITNQELIENFINKLKQNNHYNG